MAWVKHMPDRLQKHLRPLLNNAATGDDSTASPAHRRHLAPSNRNADTSAMVSAGLLALPPLQRPSHYPLGQQWHQRAAKVPQKGRDDSGGTAPDFHGIPY
jgi:hypothetical protein